MRNTKLQKLGFSDTPPTKTLATDTHSQSWLRECFAWHLLCNCRSQTINNLLNHGIGSNGKPLSKPYSQEFINDIKQRQNNLARIIKLQEQSNATPSD